MSETAYQRESREWIRSHYSVNPYPGRRVVYTGDRYNRRQLGTVLYCEKGHVVIRLDGQDDSEVGTYHPIWELSYLGPETEALLRRLP